MSVLFCEKCEIDVWPETLLRTMLSINVNHSVGDYTALSKKTYEK